MKDARVAAACVEGECVFFFGDDDFFGWVGFKEGDACGEADYAGAGNEDVALDGYGRVRGGRGLRVGTINPSLLRK